MMMTSLSAGRYAPPAMHGPITAAICGIAQLAPHQRVVVEDAAAPYCPGKDAVLIGQIDAGRIHQVDDRQPIAHRDFLRAQNLGDGLRPPRAGFHRGVVGDDDGGPAFDARQAGDDAGGGSLAVVAVVGDQQADFQKDRARDRSVPRCARARSACRRDAASRLFAAPPPWPKPVFQLLQFFHSLAHTHQVQCRVRIIDTMKFLGLLLLSAPRLSRKTLSI